MIKKKGVNLIFILFLVSLFSINIVLSLGISPAKKYVEFIPNLELEYDFKIFADQNQKVELYKKGDFADFAIIDKKSIVGNGIFNVKIKLPEKASKPGPNILLIGAREVIGEEGGLSASVAVQAPIKIMVPYPGKYVELNLITTNANRGQNMKFEVIVYSRGEEAITALTSIDIFDINDNKVKKINFETVKIAGQNSHEFTKFFNTSIFSPGDYKAVASVNYGEKIVKAESKFRIGKLFVKITNFTREIIKEGIKQFNIEIESLWNDPIENVFAEVYFSKENKELIDFQTPSNNLKPWEKTTITGYVDTDKLELGNYNTKIVLNYNNKTTAYGKLNLIKKDDYTNYYIGVGLVLLIFIYLIGRMLKRK